ncbi:MAG: bifunctional diaminohydroxyphosphoribosylaminopyrimidine deaminase/5-amino-6-(5-phosphoribosylamino)uracil reductase RibD [Pseudomonadota bacterium]
MNQQAPEAAADRRFMAMALALGRRGLGRVWPNPAVGCVLVSPKGRVVGRGWTAEGGRPHAEVQALVQAGPLADGATAYVTLEPCAHHGETPPCAEALIKAGVVRVVSAVEDPDQRVCGRGHGMLRDGGISVTVGVLEELARADHRGFFARNTLGRPFLTLKLAASIDGKIATANGESQWITGSAARRRVHLMRASHDAVLVGGGTARQDDPSLTVRGLGISHATVRVVAARHLDLPTDGQLALTAPELPVWLCHGADADAARITVWQRRGARMFEVGTGPDRQLSPLAILEALGTAGLTRVFCEGGGAFAASLLGADLVDELVIFQAGVALGAEGIPAIGALGLDRLSDAHRFDLRSQMSEGPDTVQIWRRNR